jgi:8-oxo-dGTP diphosphatase
MTQLEQMNTKKSNRPYLAVRAIITDGSGRVLILKRANTSQGDGKWCLPGGNIEYGQTTGEAMAREINQETSLNCTDYKFLFYLENLPSEESELHYINLVYLCSTKGKVQLNNESSDFAWIDSVGMKNYKIAFRNDEILLRYWHLNT